ncbi:AfsR/SARP family transcriptional regulator [Paractinoplanes globisporus]|uniref:BTAD domain-containing putative transcriptional regulator n=1 Tax=Paractinoplanes globisporus TaxID=113565 RepID=A0ABW6W467_9ACTN|nr:BTAD domain-containing putative transcriptional regulator [Actinoplanes globisporus]
MIEVCVLGPLELRAGEPVPLGGHQQQAVLAMLVAARGRVVPADRIVDQVWGGEPPASATATLQAYVSRLRRLLEPDRPPRAAPSILISEAAGYALRLPTAAVDAWRFERDVTLSGDLPPQQALGVLREALGRWRGVPYEQFADEEWARAEVARLSELRRAAQERGIAAMLRIGRIGDAVPAARALADAEPLRGEAWRLLALGLWAAHRSAEALDALREHRQHLADEVGLDPEPALSTLERAILGQRTEVLDQAVGGAQVRPAQLPRSLAGFAAREAELDELTRFAGTLAVISGAGGVGKTTLAVRWAHAVADRYSDGQLYADLRGFGPEEAPADPADVLFGFLTALGVPDHRVPPSLGERVALFRSVLAGRRMLVLLDNAADADQVRSLLPGTHGCTVVVTSRNQLGGLVVAEGAHTLRLDAFDDEEARGYLRQRLGAERTDQDAAARDEIVARCGGLPLALAVVCARAITRDAFSLDVIAAELRDTGLDAFTVEGFQHDPRSVFSWSYRHLPSTAAALFRHLALHPGPDVTRAAAISVAGPDARALLRQLCNAHLLDEHRPGRYVYHDLVRSYAVELAHRYDDPARHLDVLGRLVDHYLHSAGNAVELCFPFRTSRRPPCPPDIEPETFDNPRDAYAWQDAEYENVMALTEACDDAYLGAFVWVLCPHQQDIRFHVRDSIALARRALTVAERSREQWWVGFLQYVIGRGHLRLNEVESSRAPLEAAIAVGRATNDPTRLAHGLLSVATGIVGVHRVPTREQTMTAYPYAIEALAEYRRLGDETGRVEEANALHPIAWYHFYRPGGREKAQALLQESIDINRRSGNLHGAAGSWMHMARFRSETGDPAGAVSAFEQALELYGDMQDLRIEPLIGLYTTHLAAGDEKAAARARAEALSLLDTARYPDIDRLRAILG